MTLKIEKKLELLSAIISDLQNEFEIVTMQEHCVHYLSTRSTATLSTSATA